MGNVLLLVDGDPLIFRSFYGNSDDQGFRSDGLPTGAVTGFLSRLWDLLRDNLKDHRFSHAAIVFDTPGKNWRHQKFPAYKANREERPVDLKIQLEMAKAFMPWFGLNVIEQRGEEADDIIATYCRLNDEAGGETVVASSDKDLFSLIKPGTVIFNPMSGGWVDEKTVDKKFGVKPHLVPEVLALMGDSVDNVPGVPKVGPKTAAALVNYYGSIDVVLSEAKAGTIEPHLASNIARTQLVEHAEDARISRELVELNNYVAVRTPLEGLKARAPDAPSILRALAALEVVTFARRVAFNFNLRADEHAPLPAMVELSGEMMEWRSE